MKEKYTKLKRSIGQLQRKLRVPLAAIEKIEQELKTLYLKERKLREKSRIKQGTRYLGAKDTEQLRKCEKEINKYIRLQKAIEKDHKEDFLRLRKYIKEADRIRLKDRIYRIDTELDGLMTCFKISFANLCSFLLCEFMNYAKYENIYIIT